MKEWKDIGSYHTIRFKMNIPLKYIMYMHKVMCLGAHRNTICNYYLFVIDLIQGYNSDKKNIKNYKGVIFVKEEVSQLFFEYKQL